MSGDPIVAVLGLNVASAAAYDFIKFGVQRRFNKSRSFWSRLSTYLQEHGGLWLSPNLLEAKLFEPDVWFALMISDDTEQWLTAIARAGFPSAGRKRAVELRSTLRDGVIKLGEADIRALVSEAVAARWLGSEIEAVQAATGRIELQLSSNAALVQSLADSLAERGMHESTSELTEIGFDSELREHFRSFNTVVEWLTEDQTRVIHTLSRRSRALITGAAGSGKTVVAAQKARWLANAGVATLFLCHNPQLADHVRGLVAGTSVDVESFSAWIARTISGRGDLVPPDWIHTEEPSTEDLVEAAIVLERDSAGYLAVVVDEGQDFKPDWWLPVQAALQLGEHGMLYIFADDTQALLPYRAAYPETEVRVSLTRNCRNAGRVYSTMGRVCPGLPDGEASLDRLGYAAVCGFDRADPAGAVTRALYWLGGIAPGEDVVVLSTERVLDELQGTTVPGPGSPVGVAWQEAVRRYLRWVASNPDRSFRWWPEIEAVEQQLFGLSAAPTPTAADIELVRQLVLDEFTLEPDGRRQVQALLNHVAGMSLTNSFGRVRLHDPERASGLSYAESPELVLRYFQRCDWARGLQGRRDYRLSRSAEVAVGTSGQASDRAVKLATFADYKGLESDAAIVLWDGTGIAATSELLVGTSRARYRLALMVAAGAERVLPAALRARVVPA